ncbi:MAG: hypothetical protein HQK53_12910 [Oligoflexia bacterium]|nr:hypothetical protein [Oligoflexia bacterium]
MDENKKYESTLFPYITSERQKYWQVLVGKYRLTIQELRLALEAAIDLEMWGATADFRTLLNSWEEEAAGAGVAKSLQQGRERKEWFLHRLFTFWENEKKRKKVHVAVTVAATAAVVEFKAIDSGTKIAGMCPVASEKTVCCNLRTVDVLQGCHYQCSYCSVQTFYTSSTQNKNYGKKVINYEINLLEKLNRISEYLLPKGQKRYHLGIGQSSDGLLLGKLSGGGGGGFDALFDFLRGHRHFILELKSKSAQVENFLLAMDRHRRKYGANGANRANSDIARNLFCSWTLNTNAIICGEEHLAPSVEERLAAARAVADQGVKVAFHFHPIVYYQNWEDEYAQVVSKVLTMFSPREIAMISFGTVTLIRPVIKQLRIRGASENLKSKILQMPLCETAVKGRWSYPEEIKIEMFKHLYGKFSAWHDQLFFYLCMESSKCWEKVFGRCYPNNHAFEEDICNALQIALAL